MAKHVAAERNGTKRGMGGELESTKNRFWGSAPDPGAYRFADGMLGWAGSLGSPAHPGLRISSRVARQRCPIPHPTHSKCIVMQPAQPRRYPNFALDLGSAHIEEWIGAANGLG